MQLDYFNDDIIWSTERTWNHPIVFTLSNPTNKAEFSAEQATVSDLHEQGTVGSSLFHRFVDHSLSIDRDECG
jgi:malic enzyme